jgi:hypothetical protein
MRGGAGRVETATPECERHPPGSCRRSIAANKLQQPGLNLGIDLRLGRS